MGGRKNIHRSINMLKNKLWIVALFAALTMAFFGCTNLGLLDDGTAPVAPEDLVVYGADLEYTVIGNTSQTSVSGNIISFTNAGTSTGFSFKIPEGADAYTKLVVYFDVVSIDAGRPGLLIKKNNRMENVTGITSNQDPRYQFCDVTGTNGEIAYNFAVGKEWNTGEWEINRFDGVVAFQHQAYVPTNNNAATYSLKLIKVVFPGVADATVVFDADGGAAVGSIIVQQGKEIGDLPVTTKDGAAFLGWYTTTAITIQTEEGEVTLPVGTEVLSDFMVPFGATLTLKAHWASSGVTLTKNSLIHANPALSDPDGSITVSGNSATFATSSSWPAVKYVFPTEVTTANGSGTLLDPYTYKYNVVELTVTASEDFAIQVKDQNKGSDINKYPTGDQVVSLKKGVNTTFSVALSDSGANGLSIQNKSNDNTGGAVVTIVSAVFTKGTMYTVSFDGSVPMKFTDVATQTIISGRKATKPSTGNSGWIINTNLNVYDFIGWYLDGKPYDFDAAVTKDIDLVSKWTVINQRIVTFDLTGLTVTEPTGFAKVQAIDTILPDSTQTPPVTGNPATSSIILPTITAGIPTNSTFGGWFDVSVTPFVKYYDGATSTWAVTTIPKDITLKALFATTFEVALGTGTTPSVVPDTNTHEATFGKPQPDATYAAATGLSVDFSTGTATGSNRKTIFIPLTTAQHTSLKSAISVTLTITTNGGTTGQYRWGFGDNTLGGDWNGTALPNWAAFDNGANTSSPNFMPYAKNGDATTLKNVLIQSNNASDTLVITKIEVSVVQ